MYFGKEINSLSIDGIDKTGWSCPWNSDQNCTQNSARVWWGVQGVGRVVGSMGWVGRGGGIQEVGGWAEGGGGPGGHGVQGWLGVVGVQGLGG